MAAPALQGKAPTKLRRGLGNRKDRTPADDMADLARKERREKMLRLRVQGVAWHAVAEQLGISRRQVQRDWDHYLAEVPAPTVQAVREEENACLERERERLDVLVRVVQSRLFETKKNADGRDVPVLDLSSSLDCIRAIARVSEKLIAVSAGRRKLHGADAPEQREHSGPGGGPIPVATAETSLPDLLALMDENEAGRK